MLILDDPSTWPDHLNARLNQSNVIKLIQQNKWMDELVRHVLLRTILEEIEDYVAANPLAVYHCTKQLSERPYSVSGLRVLNFEEHHNDIRDQLRNHELVTPSLFQKIDKGLTDWEKNHTGTREKMLWFCVDRQLVFDQGTESFFKYFGGEAVYFPFMDDPEVAQLLEQLGEPVVVEAQISSRDLKVFQEFAFARTLVSYFAKSVNDEFMIEGREGFLSRGVEPSDIVVVYAHDEFVKTYRSRHEG
jgi:hypothetical protein